MPNSRLKNACLLALVFTLLTLPNFFAFSYGAYGLVDLVKTELLSVAFLVIPAVFFYRNLKLYAYLLIVFIIFSPIVIFSIITYKLEPGFEFFTLILQTNFGEMAEITKGHRVLLILVVAVNLVAYVLAISKITIKRSSLIPTLALSLLAITVIGFKLYRDWKQSGAGGVKSKIYRYYPASVINGIADVLPFIRNNSLARAKTFTFHSYTKDSPTQRKVFVFIIGESSRYSKWQIYGYQRPTNPKLIQRENLTAFTNVTAAANTTMFAVPQMITRATPDDMDRQYREKSILSVFKEVGFKTAWLSNQPNHDAFWSGSILLHAQTADVVYFPPTQFPYFDVNSYDGRYLPILDSLISATDQNLFVVIHTMGSHWDYAKRYPSNFEYFKPANTEYDGTAPVNSFTNNVLNAYDNTIRYTDYFIDSVISIVKKQNTNSFVTYCADHGEYLFDSTYDHTVNHLKPSQITLHVPMLVWTSENYNKTYPNKVASIFNNKDKKVSASNIFCSLADLGNIQFNGYDSTLSIASPAFQESSQMYYVNDSKGTAYFKDLH